jgi:hypothetical protein
MPVEKLQLRDHQKNDLPRTDRSRIGSENKAGGAAADSASLKRTVLTIAEGVPFTFGPMRRNLGVAKGSGFPLALPKRRAFPGFRTAAPFSWLFQTFDNRGDVVTYHVGIGARRLVAQPVGVKFAADFRAGPSGNLFGHFGIFDVLKEHRFHSLALYCVNQIGNFSRRRLVVRTDPIDGVDFESKVPRKILKGIMRGD